MIHSKHFYNKTIRRATTVFGTLFNNISIVNYDESEDKITQRIKVPISYGPRNKLIQRILAEPGSFETPQQQVAIQLPRMTFELVGMDYNSEEAVSVLQRKAHSKIDRAIQSRAGAPYRLSFELTIVGKYRDDALQILEQILPYFRPDFIVSVKDTEYGDQIWDMPISLISVAPEDTYQGSFEDSRRLITFVLSFELKTHFYGGLSGIGDGDDDNNDFPLINKVTVTINTDRENFFEEDNSHPDVTHIIEAIPGASPGDIDFPGYEIITTRIENFD